MLTFYSIPEGSLVGPSFLIISFDSGGVSIGILIATIFFGGLGFKRGWIDVGMSGKIGTETSREK